MLNGAKGVTGSNIEEFEHLANCGGVKGSGTRDDLRGEVEGSSNKVTWDIDSRFKNHLNCKGLVESGVVLLSHFLIKIPDMFCLKSRIQREYMFMNGTDTLIQLLVICHFAGSMISLNKDTFNIHFVLFPLLSKIDDVCS